MEVGNLAFLRRLLEELLIAYPTVWASAVSCFGLVEFSSLPDPAKFKDLKLPRGDRKFSRAELKLLENQLREWLEAGIIAPTDDPATAFVVIVPKPDR